MKIVAMLLSAAILVTEVPLDVLGAGAKESAFTQLHGGALLPLRLLRMLLFGILILELLFPGLTLPGLVLPGVYHLPGRDQRKYHLI